LAVACGVVLEQTYQKRSTYAFTDLDREWWAWRLVPYPRLDDLVWRELMKAINDEPGALPI
jgi:hypothetical protein